MQAQENRVALDEEQLLFLAGGQDNAIDEDVDEQPVQDLALNVDNVFQADECDAFDSDVDEALTAQTMFIANLSSADPVYDEAGLSYDSDILSEVHDHDHYQDAICEHHEEHTMHDNVQLNHVVDSYANYTSDGNMIPVRVLWTLGLSVVPCYVPYIVAVVALNLSCLTWISIPKSVLNSPIPSCTYTSRIGRNVLYDWVSKASMAKLRVMVNSDVGMRHWKLKQEDP
nr:retrovirus-related Pol polyprotein from transposon TNT 1-94 [Tanacetum cinerariifolium]